MDHIVIIEGFDLDRLKDWADNMSDNKKGARRVRACVDGDGLKLKVNEYTWSAPFGKLDPECQAALDSKGAEEVQGSAPVGRTEATPFKPTHTLIGVPVELVDEDVLANDLYYTVKTIQGHQAKVPGNQLLRIISGQEEALERAMRVATVLAGAEFDPNSAKACQDAGFQVSGFTPAPGQEYLEVEEEPEEVDPEVAHAIHVVLCDPCQEDEINRRAMAESYIRVDNARNVLGVAVTEALVTLGRGEMGTAYRILETGLKMQGAVLGH